MARKDFLDNEDFKILHYGFDGSVVLNKKTGRQEWVQNGMESGIPRRPRYKPKMGW